MLQTETSFPKETLIPEVISDLGCIALEGVMRAGLNHVFKYISAKNIKAVLSKDITVAQAVLFALAVDEKCSWLKPFFLGRKMIFHERTDRY